MMADAADEIIMFKEYVDTEQMVVCNVAIELPGVKERLRELFNTGLCADTGYTSLALHTLAKDRMIRKTQGSLPSAATTACPMRCCCDAIIA